MLAQSLLRLDRLSSIFLGHELPFHVTRPEDIRRLAKKSQSEWVNLVKERHAAGEINLPFQLGEIAGQATFPQAEFYARVLERQFREAFPTAAW